MILSSSNLIAPKIGALHIKIADIPTQFKQAPKLKMKLDFQNMLIV